MTSGTAAVRRWRRPRRLIGGAIAFAILVAVVVGVVVLRSRASAEPQLRGIVTSVEARDIGHAASLMLRTADGKETRFLLDASVDPQWTPGHLRDHMTFAQPVTIWYRRAGDALVAYRITD
jgi:hypothetical protein